LKQATRKRKGRKRRKKGLHPTKDGTRFYKKGKKKKEILSMKKRGTVTGDIG